MCSFLTHKQIPYNLRISWIIFVGHSRGSFLWVKLVGHSRGSNSWVILVGHSRGSNSWVILVGHSWSFIAIGHSCASSSWVLWDPKIARQFWLDFEHWSLLAKFPIFTICYMHFSFSYIPIFFFFLPGLWNSTHLKN